MSNTINKHLAHRKSKTGGTYCWQTFHMRFWDPQSFCHTPNSLLGPCVQNSRQGIKTTEKSTQNDTGDSHSQYANNPTAKKAIRILSSCIFRTGNISNKKPLLTELWEGKTTSKTSFHTGLLGANADTNTDKAGQYRASRSLSNNESVHDSNERCAKVGPCFYFSSVSG